MSMPPSLPPPGWYADPSGRRGRLRWWDGTAWSTLVRDSGRGWGRTPWLVLGALLAVALVAAIAIPAITSPRPGPTSLPPGSHPPGSQPPGSQPAAPTISAAPPTVGPTRSTSDEACTSGDPLHRQAHPTEPGVAFGGGYRYAIVPGWSEGVPPQLPFGNDLAGGRPNNPGSPAWFALGAIRANIDDFAAPQLAARAIAECLHGSADLQGLAKLDGVDVPTSVEGTRETATVLAHFGPGDGAPTRTVVIVVSDTGAAESMPFFIVVGGFEGPSSDQSMLAHRARLARAS